MTMMPNTRPTPAVGPVVANRLTPVVGQKTVEIRPGTALISVADAVASGARTLAAYSDSPRLDAELLLGKILGLSRSALIAHSNDTLTQDWQDGFTGLLEQRLAGAPIAYLTGTREFWSLPLAVTPAVLVPRPETELLVELALGLLPKDRRRSLLDLGTGSGAIALAIAAERPQSHITGVDVSPAALAVATSNATALGLSGIAWRLGSWFDAVPDQRFDMIVANPPYIASADPALLHLTQEPAIALCSGATGLEALAEIAAEAAAHLHPHGWLLMEHGSGQSAEVAQLLERHGFTSVRSYSDFSGKPRVTLGTIHTQQ
jgi:release factor glutamine methyltransferase